MKSSSSLSLIASWAILVTFVGGALAVFDYVSSHFSLWIVRVPILFNKLVAQVDWPVFWAVLLAGVFVVWYPASQVAAAIWHFHRDFRKATGLYQDDEY